MKKKLTFIVLIWTIVILTVNLSSCTGSNTKPPDGFAIGEVKSYVGRNKAERNFISQYNSYNNALLRSDVDNALKYLYPDAIRYSKKIFINKSTDEVIKEVFKGASTMLVRLDSIYSASGVELSIVAFDIKKQIDLGQRKLYIFDITIQIYKEDAKKEKFLHSIPSEKTLGITLNNGKNWTFLSLNDDTPNILRLRFSEDVINQVMGY